jgi:predicted nucleic acid-binding protein
MRLGVGAVAKLRGLLKNSSSLKVVRVSDLDFDHAVDFMLAQGDKRWSLTDCTSVVLMRELEVANAFTFDHNFCEAGFRVLPG